jgi:DNA modification methylase
MERTIQIACQGALTLPHTELVPFQGSLKSLSEEDYVKLKTEITERGFSEPISVWQSDGKNFILNGHQRLRTIQQMLAEGWEVPPLPVSLIFADSYKEAKHKCLSLASQYGKVEGEGLYEFIMDAELDVEAVFDSFRFPEIDFEDFKAEYFDEPTRVPGCDEDDAPGAPAESRTKIGDVYRLGPHRVLCGDATVVTDLEKLLEGRKADMVLTDPPYNVDYVGKTKDALKIQNDKMDESQFYQFLYDAYTNLLLNTKAGGAIYVAHADTEGANFRKALLDSGWLLKQCLIWVKQALVMGRQDYHWRHEPILYGWAPGESHRWFSDRKQTTILEFDKPSRSEDHPTMKPVGLVEYLIGNSSQKGELVLDSFLGSGTTLIACEKSGRVCYGLELDPKYVDVIVERWEKFTGQKAELVGGIHES